MIASLLLYTYLFASPASSLTKVWSSNASEFWQPVGKDSCKTSAVVLKRQLDGLFYMGSQLQSDLHEVVLPTDGVVVLPDVFNLKLSDSKNCDQSNYVILDQTSPKPWFSVDSWITKNVVNNIAKPHIDRIPCECDTVIFPTVSGVSIDLELVDEIVVEKILINNREGDFTRFLETEVGQRMFSNSEAVRFEKGVCRPPKHRGCHSYKRFHEYLSVLCQNESPKCEVPHCLDPIQPIGHCCPICGASIEFDLKENASEFNLDQLYRLVQSKLVRFQNGKYANLLHFFVGMMPRKMEDDKIAQVIIAETEEYTGISGKFLSYIGKDPHFQGSENFPIKNFVAGMPYIPSTGSAWPVVFCTLLLVLSFYGMIYVYFVKQPQMPDWVPISRFQPFRRSVVFARFDTRQTDANDENGDITVEFNEPSSIAERSVMGFDNPLFKSESNKEDKDEEADVSPNLLNEADNGDDAEEYNASIKLVDVDLETDRL